MAAIFKIEYGSKARYGSFSVYFYSESVINFYFFFKNSQKETPKGNSSWVKDSPGHTYGAKIGKTAELALISAPISDPAAVDSLMTLIGLSGLIPLTFPPECVIVRYGRTRPARIALTDIYKWRQYDDQADPR